MHWHNVPRRATEWHGAKGGFISWSPRAKSCHRLPQRASLRQRMAGNGAVTLAWMASGPAAFLLGRLHLADTNLVRSFAFL